jgi:hypothetical protein
MQGNFTVLLSTGYSRNEASSSCHCYLKPTTNCNNNNNNNLLSFLTYISNKSMENVNGVCTNKKPF